MRGVRKKHYQFTAIDDCTRLRVLKIYGQLNQKTAIQFADYVLEKFPFRVEQIQTDSGSEFQSAFHWHLLDRGLRHVYIRPSTPRLNGKVERSLKVGDKSTCINPTGYGLRVLELGQVKLTGGEALIASRAPLRKLFSSITGRVT